MAETRRQEVGRAVVAAAIASGITVAQLVGAKSARDALFLSHHDVTRLPEMMAVGAAVSLVAAVFAARAMARWAPAKVVPVVLVTNAALYAVEWWVVTHSPAHAAIALYLQVALLGSTLSAGTWALINECFDPHTAKRVVGRIAMGGTLGGAVGGLLGFWLGRGGGVPVMLGVLAVLNLAAVVPLRALGRRSKAQPAPTRAGPAHSGFDVLREHPYLRQLALLVVLVAVTSALLDYVMSARVVSHIPKGPELMAFFAVFHMGVGLSSFAIQALATRAALTRIGLAGTMSILPASVIGAAGLTLAIPGLASAVFVRGADALVQSSLYRAAYEVAYTPVPRLQKRPAKMLIDVGFDRVGTALGSGLVLQILRSVAQVELVLLVLALGVSVLSLITAMRLHRGYVSALAQSLKRGAVRLSERDVLDATTRRTLAETAGLDRKKLLESIERHRANAAIDSEHPPSGSHSEDRLEGLMPHVREEGFGSAPLSLRFVLTPDRDAPSELSQALDDLRSGSPERARRHLTRDGELELELVPAAIELLGNDALSRDALRALRRLGPRITGQLVDNLLDAQVSAVVRRRIPRALETSRDPRATSGLIEALAAPELEVRCQAAFALQRLSASPGAPELPAERVFSAVRLELEQGAEASREQSDDEGAREAALAFVEQAIVVLSLVLEREPLSLAYRALGSADEGLRGTALEYFETVLPEKLRATAVPLLSRLVPQGGPKRDTAALRDELLKTRSG